MPTYDFKGDIAKAAWFQPKYDQWIAEVLKRKPILNMEANHIKWLYNNDAIFKQFVDVTKELRTYLNKVENALEK